MKTLILSIFVALSFGVNAESISRNSSIQFGDSDLAKRVHTNPGDFKVLFCSWAANAFSGCTEKGGTIYQVPGSTTFNVLGLNFVERGGGGCSFDLGYTDASTVGFDQSSISGTKVFPNCLGTSSPCNYYYSPSSGRYSITEDMDIPQNQYPYFNQTSGNCDMTVRVYGVEN